MNAIMPSFRVTTSDGAVTTITAPSKAAARRAVGGTIVKIEEVPEAAKATVYRDIDDVPEIPAGLAIYRADMVSGIPDDDGGPSRFDRWCLALNPTEALATFEIWAEDVHEGIVINDIEQEEVSS